MADQEAFNKTRLLMGALKEPSSSASGPSGLIHEIMKGRGQSSGSPKWLKPPERAAYPIRRVGRSRAVVELDPAVQNGDTALVKLNCLGIASCHGKLTLTASDPAKTKGAKGAKGGKKARAVTIGRASYSIAGDETKTVKLDIDSAGQALLKADHGRCSASMAILELAPSPTNTQTKTVQLVQRKARGGKR